MDKEIIIQDFIKNFIAKDRQERTRIELENPKKRGQFVDRLNHTWEKVFDMRKLKSLPKVQDDYEYVKTELKIKDNELCYLISNYADIDDQFLDFKTAFDESYGRGFGTLIINSTVDKIYLETEEIGHQYRFTGRLRN